MRMTLLEQVAQKGVTENLFWSILSKRWDSEDGFPCIDNDPTDTLSDAIARAIEDRDAVALAVLCDKAQELGVGSLAVDTVTALRNRGLLQ